jgi:hypothetical protein
MVDKVVEFRPKVPETEKITINLGHVDWARSTCWCGKGSTRTGPT